MPSTLTLLTWLSPLLAWALLALGTVFAVPVVLVVLVLGACVISAVHHAEVIAHRIGEPFGTLTLALAVTFIEVGLIVSLMAGAGDEAATLARDTVIAAVMIILNGIVGICLLIGGLRHHEQSFQQAGVSAALTPACWNVCSPCRSPPISRQMPTMPLRMIITAAITVSRASVAASSPAPAISETIRPTSMKVTASASVSVPNGSPMRCAITSA